MLHDIYYTALLSSFVIYGFFIPSVSFLPLLSLILKLPASAQLTEALLIIYDCSVFSLLLKPISISSFYLLSLVSIGRLLFIGCLRNFPFTESFTIWVIAKYNFMRGHACLKKVQSSLPFMLF